MNESAGKDAALHLWHSMISISAFQQWCNSTFWSLPEAFEKAGEVATAQKREGEQILKNDENILYDSSKST